MSSAKDIASIYMSDLFSDGSAWRVGEIALHSVAERWVYLISFDPPLPPGCAAHSPGARACTTAHAIVGIRSAVSAAPTSPTLLAVRRCDPPAAHNDNCCGLTPRACRPGVRSWQTAPPQTPHPLSSRQAPPVFSYDRLERFFVQAEIGHQLLQPAVLVFQTPQPLRFPNLHPAILTLPAVQRRLADAVLPRQLRDLPPPSCSFRIPTICSSLNRPRFMAMVLLRRYRRAVRSPIL